MNTPQRDHFLIPNYWYAILESSEVKKGRPHGVTRMREKLVLWRDHYGVVQCLADKCVHRGVSLSTGKILKDNVQCPFHGFEYDRIGQCRKMPANGRASPIPPKYVAPSYLVRENHGLVWLWWGEKRETYPELPFFDDLDDSFHGKPSGHYGRPTTLER
jgi:phenylpropionate dioxygenase-like ring-hydroxylating dioxygenase large terminal subunit